MLLGVRAVIAESYERIHRSNLVGMGVLPLQFHAGQNAASLGLTGEEIYDIEGLAEALAAGFARGRDLVVQGQRPGGQPARLRPWSGSTRRRRCSTTSTAASCSTSCGNYFHKHKSDEPGYSPPDSPNPLTYGLRSKLPRSDPLRTCPSPSH